MKYDVFISCSRKEQAIVNELRKSASYLRGKRKQYIK